MSEKEAGQVLTSENSAEFYANKLGLAEINNDVAVEEAPEPSEVDNQSEQVEQGEAKTTEEKKQNPKLEKRFSELTKQREQAKAEAQAERQQREALEARLRVLEQQALPPQQVKSSNEEPQPGQFQDAFEYAKALAQYSTEQALQERDQQEANRKANEELQKTIQSWSSRLEKVKAEIPDYDDVVSTANVTISEDIKFAILESDVGPRILYHLAEDLEFAQKLAQMPNRKAMIEIGKLEKQYEKGEVKQEPVVKSKAPAPIRPLKASGGVADIPINSSGEFHGTYQAWKEARRAGKIR
jgi:hypothetical protein